MLELGRNKAKSIKMSMRQNPVFGIFRQNFDFRLNFSSFAKYFYNSEKGQ